MSFGWVVQPKIFAALNGVISCPVYDVAPQNSNYPYVIIGDEISNENVTDTTINNQVVFSVHVWSQKDSSKEAKHIQGEIYDALHLTRFVDVDYAFTETYFVNSQAPFIDSDGVTRHGVQEFKLTIEKV